MNDQPNKTSTENDRAIPPCMSKRNHVGSIHDVIERVMDGFPEAGRVVSADEMKRALLKFSETLSYEFRAALILGAERGMEQAASLMEDPDYYETVKERRRREMVRQGEDQQRQKVERAERDHDPEYRAKRVADFRKWIDDAKANVHHLNERLSAYLAMCDENPPKLVRMPMPANVPNWTIKGFVKTEDTGVQGGFEGIKAVENHEIKPEGPAGTPVRVK